MIALPIWVYPAAGALVLVAGFGAGWSVKGAYCDQARSAALERAAKQLNAAQIAANAAAASYEQERSHADTDTRARETAIRTIYRDRVVRADCALVSGGVLAVSRDRANARITGEPGSELQADPAAARAADQP